MFATTDQGVTTDPARLSTDEVEDEIARLAAEIAATTCRWLLLVAEFERRGAHEEAGFHCCAAWLAWRCSLSKRTARDHLRVARRLGELPRVRAAFSTGELSYSKARAIARVSRTPEMEAELIELAAQATAAQLERVAGACAGALSREQAEENLAGRHFSWEWDEDGTLAISGRLDGEDGALLLRALEAGCEALRREGGEDARPSNADALVAMAESLLASGPLSRRGAERHRVVVHLDSEVLASGGCQIEDGPPISAETARRIACEAPVVFTGAGAGAGSGSAEPRGRSIPAATRRAVRIRDRGCRFPGCENRHWVDAHHITHWADGGASTKENLVQLCRRHHRLVHEGGFGVERRADGEVVFRRPDGSPIPVVPPQPRLRRLPSKRLRGAAHGAPMPMPAPLAGGQRLDLDLAVSGLLARAGPSP